MLEVCRIFRAGGSEECQIASNLEVDFNDTRANGCKVADIFHVLAHMAEMSKYRPPPGAHNHAPKIAGAVQSNPVSQSRIVPKSPPTRDHL